MFSNSNLKTLTKALQEMPISVLHNVKSFSLSWENLNDCNGPVPVIKVEMLEHRVKDRVDVSFFAN